MEENKNTITANRSAEGISSSSSLHHLEVFNGSEGSALPFQDEGISPVKSAMPLKKRKYSVCFIVYEDKAFPPKKRHSYVPSMNPEILEEQLRMNQDNVEDNVEEGGVVTHVNTMVVEEEETGKDETSNVAVKSAKNEEGEENGGLGVQVSNPISLIAIAASWLTDFETLTDSNAGGKLKQKEQMKPIPRAYAFIDPFDSEVDNTMTQAMDNKMITLLNANAYDQENNVEASDAATEEYEEKHKHFTRPRSRLVRRPKTSYNSILFHIKGEDKKVNKEEQTQEQTQEGVVVFDDLYSTVKTRRSRLIEAKATEGTRCTRVNGKGWRCSKLARVGYALCDHHLRRQKNLRHKDTLRAPKKKAGRHPKVGRPARSKEAEDEGKVRSLKSVIERTAPICIW